jgi:hypothetical protein
MDPQKLHKALLRPETYPEKTGSISFRETHISRLYFTDRHVYKIKKAVDFGFLNFTTLDRRRFYCHEEVRLNRRFCPGTYLGVVEIRKAEERIMVNGQGKIVDYAVLMKRLPEKRMLDHMIQCNGHSLLGEMDRVARHIAKLHQESEICRGNGGPSNLEVIRRNWRENFTQTAPFSGKTLSNKSLDLFSTYVSRFLEKYASLLLRRQEEGFVRDGHGDLHAEHICLTKSMCIYDCIEFNQRFRVADLAADLAFLLMDLDFRNRRDLSARILTVYQEAMGKDRESNVLLPFYKIYRAYVRGKVESFLTEDTTAEAIARRQAASRARRYFNLALGYLCPITLVLTCGLMGVGKTTIGKPLADILGGTLLRSDELRKELTGLRVTEKKAEPFGKGIYTPELTRKTYDLLLERSLASIAAGNTVVADASFLRRDDRELFRKAAEKAGVPFLILFMECDKQTTFRRLDRRQALGSDASDGRRELYAQQAAAFQSIAGTKDVMRVDTARNIDYNIHSILCEITEKAGMRL